MDDNFMSPRHPRMMCYFPLCINANLTLVTHYLPIRTCLFYLLMLFSCLSTLVEWAASELPGHPCQDTNKSANQSHAFVRDSLIQAVTNLNLNAFLNDLIQIIDLTTSSPLPKKYRLTFIHMVKLWH